MFDIGWPELLLVMVIGLIVIGPKELPNAIRTVMSIVRKLRMTAREFQSGLGDIARESGLDDVKRQMDDIDFYDPGEALKSIADSEKDLLGLDDDDDLPSGNSILDPNGTYTPPDDIEAPHGDAAGPFDTTPTPDVAKTEAATTDPDTPESAPTEATPTEPAPTEPAPDVTSGGETEPVKTGGGA
jgi:sec-independent protein translocase protein TatB